MNCDHASELITERLTGAISEADDIALKEHLDSCERCREALNERERFWSELGRLTVPPPAKGGFGRLVEGLTSEESHRPSRPKWTSWLVAASVVVAMAIGFVAGRSTTDAGQQTAAPAAASNAGPDDRSFLLVLWEPAESMEEISGRSMSQLVAEYTEWGNGLARSGNLLSGRKLEEEPVEWLAGREGRQMPPDHDAWPAIGGYFTIRAADRAEAENLARTSPHLKYGGAIEVREFDREED